MTVMSEVRTYLSPFAGEVAAPVTPTMHLPEAQVVTEFVIPGTEVTDPEFVSVIS